MKLFLHTFYHNHILKATIRMLNTNASSSFEMGMQVTLYTVTVKHTSLASSSNRIHLAAGR